MSMATSLNAHPLMSIIPIDSVHSEAVDVPCVCDEWVLVTQSVYQVHDNPSVVNVLSHTSQLATWRCNRTKRFKY
jgi:hypothetical protein